MADDDYVATVRIRRPARITTDERGRSVWADTVETAQLELVSTSELQKLLASADEDTRSAIDRVVRGEDEGVIARDPATGLFEVISDAALQAILDSSEQLPKKTRPAGVKPEPAVSGPVRAGEELSLVSTQVLRKVLGKQVPKKERVPGSDKSGGFDPYDRG